MLFNRESYNTGNLLEDFTPAVNPPKEIDDSEDKKPEDWVDTRRIADPDAVKVRAEQCSVSETALTSGTA